MVTQCRCYPLINREATETTSNTDEGKKENSQIGWVLQILSRLSQVERPHDDLMSLATVKALVGYLAHTRRPLPRDAIQCCEIGVSHVPGFRAI